MLLNRLDKCIWALNSLCGIVCTNRNIDKCASRFEGLPQIGSRYKKKRFRKFHFTFRNIQKFWNRMSSHWDLCSRRFEVFREKTSTLTHWFVNIKRPKIDIKKIGSGKFILLSETSKIFEIARVVTEIFEPADLVFFDLKKTRLLKIPWSPLKKVVTKFRTNDSLIYSGR